MMLKKGLLISLCILWIGLGMGTGQAYPNPTGGVLPVRFYLPLVSGDEPPAWLGPEGGIIVALAVDPLHSNYVYAGTWGGGVFKSTDGGLRWRAANNGLGNLYINSLVVDPLNPQILYAGTYKDKIYKSTNSGDVWFAANNGIQPEAVTYALAVDPKTAGVVYAGTRGISNDGSAPWSGVLYKSVDGGATWQAKLSNIGGADQQDWIYSLAVNPTSPNIVYAASHEHGPFRSDDHGETWYAVGNGITDGSGRSIAVDPKNSATVYLGVWHNSGVFKTINGGGLWVLEENGISDSKIFNVAIDPVQPTTLYLATVNQGVMKSTNGGLNWLPTGSAPLSIYGLLVDPVNPLRVLSGTAGQGLLLSLNGGASWASAQRGLMASLSNSLIIHPTDAKIVFTGIYGQGVKKSADGGVTWSDFNYGLTDLYVNTVILHPQNSNLFYALTQSGGLFRGDRSSTLGWQRIGANLPLAVADVKLAEKNPFTNPQTALGLELELLDTTTPVYAPLLAMAFAPSNPKTVYLGTSGAGLYRSLDEGLTWQSAGLAGQVVQAVLVDTANPSLVWAASSVEGGLKFSANGGLNWSDGGLPGVVVHTLKRSPAGVMYAGTSDGVYRREGSGWVRVGLVGVEVTALGFHPSRAQIIIAGTTNGAYFTTTSGASWVQNPIDLRAVTVQDIQFDWSNPAVVYISTRGHGILRAVFRWP